MKVMRISNDGLLSYVERQICRRWWFRVSPKYRSNIEAWNWVRRRRDVELVRKG